MSELKAKHVVDVYDAYSSNPYNEAQVYNKSEADKVIAEKNAIIEEQAKEIKFMHQHCKHGERCGTSCAQIHGELMQATIEIAELKEERRWRKFPDEKPKEDTWCIVFHDGEIDYDHYTRFAYNNKCDFALYGNEVTHWMPLPSAPKEGE